MNQTALNIVEYVFPHVPARQWVISFPYKIRYWISNDGKKLSKVIKIVSRVINSYYRKRFKQYCSTDLKHGSIVFIQRFGGSLN